MPSKREIRTTHRCAYPECKADIKGGQLACRTHWYALSPRLRDRLVFAWEQRKAHPDIPELVTIHRTLLLEALREWQIPPEVIAAQMRARAPKAVQTSCPFCGAGGKLHYPGCPRLLQPLREIL